MPTEYGIDKPIQVMTLRDYLFENPKLRYQNNIFYQKDLPRNNSFEEIYLKLRAKEHRVHSDDMVRNLPEINHDHPNKREWEMRKNTLKVLCRLLSTGRNTNILELGCGNGWLSYNLAKSLNANLCAVDVNEKELRQGARVFSDQKNVCLVYANIFDSVFQPKKFDAIILGSSIQYFKNLKDLIASLFDLTKSSGTIYIADSPFYATQEKADAAKKRQQSGICVNARPGAAQSFDRPRAGHRLSGSDRYCLAAAAPPRTGRRTLWCGRFSCRRVPDHAEHRIAARLRYQRA